MIGKPAQLRDGKRREWHRADGLGPLPRPELGDQVGGRLRRPGVVPKQRWPHDVTILVKANHAVLLAADGYSGDVVQPAGRSYCFPERSPPGPRVHLGAIRVCRAALTDQRTGISIADHDLARLRRRVHTCHDGHLLSLRDVHGQQTRVLPDRNSTPSLAGRADQGLHPCRVPADNR